jgi:hypothetical protein
MPTTLDTIWDDLQLVSAEATPNNSGGYDCSVTLHAVFSVSFSLFYGAYDSDINGRALVTGSLKIDYTLARNTTQTFTFTIPAEYLTGGDLWVEFQAY